MHLLFTVDDQYVPVLGTCMQSILRFPCAQGYDLYILHAGLSAVSIQYLKKVTQSHARLHLISIDAHSFDEFPQNARYPKTMYYRLLAAEFLPQHLERVLYLDPDIIVIRSLEALYHMPFDGQMFCGATHVQKVLTRLNGVRLQAPEDAPYLNSGVLLMNLPRMRHSIRRSDILEYIERRQAYFTLPDQDILSALYGKETKLLDTYRYNLSDRMLFIRNASLQQENIDLRWVRENTVIIHYCGKNKPWKKNYHGILGCFYIEVVQSPQYLPFDASMTAIENS